MGEEIFKHLNFLDLLCCLKAEHYIILPVTFFRSSFEGFFASKGAAYALPDGDFARRATKHGGKEPKGLQSLLMQM